jgi:very-short-patch-repair endonuclease
LLDTLDAENHINELVKQKIDALRPKLLDLSRRNPLISVNLSPRSNSYVRVVDELPDVLFYKLNHNQQMRLLPLPPLEGDPKDEEAEAFVAALSNARLTDEAYRIDAEAISPDDDDYLNKSREAERRLKDRVREKLGLPSRAKAGDINITQHAKNNGVTPGYDLPLPTEAHEDGRHTDENIQTLLLPKDLERKLNALSGKCRTWLQETGLNVLHVAYGLLEWSELGSKESAFAPIILSAAKIEKRRTSTGIEFWIAGSGEEPELNAVLAEKLRGDFGIDLPAFDGTSAEAYFTELASLSPRKLNWRVRRQVVVGVFPSARLAMYHDLDAKRPGFQSTAIVTALLAGSNEGGDVSVAPEYDVDHPEVERKVPFLVLDADSSQVSTLADIADGKNLAVEGPPGTGKSQTIVNAIASALAAGKKVLFVAEKLAALNVVKSRLEAIGLGEFILPLQAERSSREQVIEAIRERMQMAAIGPGPLYEQRLREYKRARDELAAYLCILTEKFEDMDLTVRDILGRSIALNDRLAHIPLDVLDDCSTPPESWWGAGLERLRNLAGEFAKAHDDAAKAADTWGRTKLTRADRFAIEEACHFARQAANAFVAADRGRSSLAEMGFENDARYKNLGLIAGYLESFPQSAKHAPATLAAAVLDGDTADHIKQFRARCQRLQRLAAALGQALSAEPSGQTLGRLCEILEICRQNRLDTVDIESIEGRLASKRQMLNAMRTLAARVAPFVKRRPESEGWRLADFAKAFRLVKETGRDALARRNAFATAPSAPHAMRALSAEGRVLSQEKTRLAARFSLTAEVEEEQLAESLTVLRNAGAFSFLSASFRRAKRYYRSIAANPAFKKEEAIGGLEALLAWKRREISFVQNPHASQIFDLHFRGLETDFEPYDKLAAFYDALSADFAKPDSRAARDFLRDAGAEDLEALPDVPPMNRDWTYRDLLAAIASYAKDIKELEAAVAALREPVRVLANPSAVQPDQVGEIAGILEEFLAASAQLDADERSALLLGVLFKGWRTESAPIDGLIDWAGAVRSHRQLLHSLLLGESFDEARRLMRSILQAEEQAGNALAKVCEKAQVTPDHFLTGRTEKETAAILERAAQDADGLARHAELARVLREVSLAGIGPIVEEHLRQKREASELGALFEALASRKLAKAAHAKCGDALAKYAGWKLDQLRSQLAAYDRELLTLSRKEIRAKIHQSTQYIRGNGAGPKSTWKEMALIENEIAKSKRFISVRDLTQRAGRALLELKPCWMMSPLAVAQYVDKQAISFDLCIIDEASQMPPEAAVGALLRSKQTMIVGDTNQLPPTTFFKKMVDDEDADEDEAVLDESILEMANATFRPRRRLRWHYRSRHAGLIKFSNRLVYDGDLIVFPSPEEGSSAMGVEYRFVSGCYKSGTNAIEAKAVVEAALAFMRNSPKLSLGVVTLNQKQRDLIGEEFEYALNRDAAAQHYVDYWRENKDGLEQFFIKNLENVQGDERDVIFIGTVYGPEESGGRVMQRFGPINGLAGKRRLNVLFSRAKERIVTFSSMTAADIVAEETGNAGAYMLKRWLEYSATGVLEGGSVTPEQPHSDFETYVIEQIRSMGCEPIPQVGVAGYFIDIGVKHPRWPHGFILGVECDGASYHSAKSARDRDRLRQDVLEKLGWRLHRIWSTDWFANPRRQAEILRDVIAKRLEDLKAKEAEFKPAAPAPASSPAPGLPLFDQAPQPVDPKRDKRKEVKTTRKERISVGDTVRVRFLTGDKRTVQVTISSKESDPSQGIIHFKSPMAEALIGVEKGDEVEILVGSYVRQAVVDDIISKADMATPRT